MNWVVEKIIPTIPQEDHEEAAKVAKITTIK